MEILGALFGGYLSCYGAADSNKSVTAAQVNGTENDMRRVQNLGAGSTASSDRIFGRLRIQNSAGSKRERGRRQRHRDD